MKKIIYATITVVVIAVTYQLATGQGLYTAPFGVQAYTFRKSFPNGVAATLDSIKQMGFTEIEGGGNKMSAEEFKKLCDERGISIPSTGVGFEQLEKDPQEVATRAKSLGS